MSSKKCSSSSSSSSSGSQKARDIGLLRAAFRGNDKWNNTWNIMRAYNSHARHATGPPPFAATWAEIEVHVTPAFSENEINSSKESPLSPSPSFEAMERYQDGLNRMIIYERNSTAASSAALMEQFEIISRICGENVDYLKTVFLRHAFGESHTRVVDLTGITWNDFHVAWAELECNPKYNEPVFAMDKGLTHPKSPMVTGDWSMDEHALALQRWAQSRASSGGSAASAGGSP